MITVNGIDVSYKDTLIDWSKYTYDFAFVKVTEGEDIDNLFRIQWQEARGRTVRGPLTVFRPSADVKKSAIQLAETLNGDMGELPLAIYLHKTDGQPDVMNNLASFIDEYKHQSKAQTVIIYTSLDFLNFVHSEQYPFIGTYPLWLISYPFVNYDAKTREQKIRNVMLGNLMLAFPPAPRPFSRITFWRWTNKGIAELIPGYPSEKNNDVSVSFYHGEHVQDLFLEFNVKVPLTNEEEKDAVVYYGRVIRETKVRNGPWEAYPVTGTLPKGTLIQSNQAKIDNIHRKWLCVIKAENEQGGAILLDNNKQVTERPSWVLALDIEQRDIIDAQDLIIEQVIIKYADGREIKHP